LPQGGRAYQDVLEQISRYDREHGGSYRLTLAAVLKYGGDPNELTKRLHVHRNTVRYRLQRISELFGLRLEDPDFRLALWLQLRMDEL
jgi:DNA-binding PucR family transcriptional regulator